MEDSREETPTRLRRAWPWLVLALTAVPAFWHVVDFPDDPDGEFPRVIRPTFSRRPPPAYRLAEPGDTIDRVAIYLSAGTIVIAAIGLGVSRFRDRDVTLWPTALILGMAAAWHASTPGPSFDGWHGLGWRSLNDPSAPTALRGLLAVSGILGAAIIAENLVANRRKRDDLTLACRRRRLTGLLLVAGILVVLRQVEFPGVEPAGYWPRWCFAWGILAFDLALIRACPLLPSGFGRRLALFGASAGVWWGIVVGGIDLTWYHRPLSRLRTVEPGKIYISAMPTYRGLEVAYRRHPFKTIINLFPEDTDQRSPILGDEIRFAREHDITYLRSPGGALRSDAFLDRTLALARDPSAWPILVHCHGCMDRSPAWMGIYRFVDQGRPLDEVLQEIERHRGYRPKATVTLLYNRVLPALAPVRYARDATAALLKRCAAGTIDPYYSQVEEESRRANQEEGRGVSR